MPPINYEVAELVLQSLAKSHSATTAWGTVCRESALALHNNANLWNPSFNFSALPPKLQERIAQQSVDGCKGHTDKKLRCIGHIFNQVHLFDYICAPWYKRICAREEDDLFPPTPRTQSPWSWSSDRQESFVWSPRVGSSSSGSDDEDLLVKYKDGDV